ncbi:hypothetical protein EQ718_21615 (plasmid) [Paracoccus versutus]|uniref:Uncharacterized protein n=1 Tax=Paracoccus versutus TaxID=34007 RepID=A0AAQ0KLG3_PARVE|nr:hypothetical protein [Paracoccus versutus]KGJ11232.1 hypothetical protein IT40_07590 [Paracoccus versutus]REG46061.1 hypothetical protein ATH84_101781 [Paracoccus versutus]WEJ81440.1 hypothetical protein EQ718_21615 [Paracoccus versutus]
MSLEPQDDWEAEVLARFKKLGAVERLIFIGAGQALALGVFSGEQFTEWVADRLRRYRAGEDLTLADLEIPGLRQAKMAGR